MTTRRLAPSGRRSRARLPAVLGATIALGLLIALPAIALAHPLGNFTINHYAGVRVTATEIQLDIVLDRAEIPTFQERLKLDTDGDGEISEAEAETAREPGCAAVAASLEVSIDGRETPLEVTATGLSFPPGAGGLSTMRLVCQISAPIDGGIGTGRSVVFADRSFPDRLGWREIVVQGDGTTVMAEGDIPAASISNRLTAYPEDRLLTPLAMTEARFTVTPGGPSLPPFSAPDAGSGAVPGGVGAEIPDVFRTTDLSPSVLLLALGTALALGAGHALTPGHGKTLMAAYLVGTRGTAIHALGLGLSVTVSHTLGILVLAALVVGAQGVLPADAVVRWTPLVAALTIVAIGGWMVIAELRRRRARRSLAQAATHDHDHDHDHDDGHEHADPHGRDHHHAEHGHEHADPAEHGHDPVPDDPAGVHSHGGIRHSHLPPADTTITWRSLFALGLAGGIIPSTSALLILLGTIAAGRAAFGVLLVIAFGLGMALVLAGVGILLVKSRSLLDRLPASSRLGRLSTWAPLAAAVLVFGVGIWLTGQAIGGAVVF